MYNQSSGVGGDRGVPPIVSLPSIPLPPDLAGIHQEKALNLHMEQRARAHERESLARLESERKEEEEREEERERNIRREMELKRERLEEAGRGGEDEGVSPPPCKRAAGDLGEEENSEDEEDEVTALGERIHSSLPGTNIKITSRGEWRAPHIAVSTTHSQIRYFLMNN